MYSYTSDGVQPEMLMYSEKGVAFASTDFRNRRYRIEREMKRNNEEALPDEVQARMFKQFVRNNLTAKPGQYYPLRMADWSTYSLFPLYYSFVTQLDEGIEPLLSIALEAYFNERNINKTPEIPWYADLAFEEKVNLELAGHSMKSIIQSGITPDEDDEEPVKLRDLVLMKGKYLFNLLRAHYGEKEIDTLLSQLAIENRFKKINPKELSRVLFDNFGLNLDSTVNEWYNQGDLPAFVMSGLSSYKVVQNEDTRFQIRFILSNTGKVSGFVTINIEENNPNRKNNNWWEQNFVPDVSRKIYIPASSSREIGFLLNTEPARMAVVTHVSGNLPYNLVMNLPGFGEIRNVPAFDGIVAIPYQHNQEKKDEIIVDNEDKGFSFQQTSNQAYLKSIVSKNRQPKYKYDRIQSWSPVREWKAVLKSEFYGEAIRSAYYTRSGSGERKASWKAVLPEAGMYEVYFYLAKPSLGWRRNNREPDYNLTVYHDGGAEKINQASEGVDNGWLYLWQLSFYFRHCKS
ncbi:MAG: hypothetical protein HC905_18350 [Bacteroidales bacterium]|nr:hypothetical protein [Bacteroidales bacterium]